MYMNFRAHDVNLWGGTLPFSLSALSRRSAADLARDSPEKGARRPGWLVGGRAVKLLGRYAGKAPQITSALALGRILTLRSGRLVLLTFLARDLQLSRDGVAAAVGLACGLVGLLVARCQPCNPEGWHLLAVLAGVFAVLDSELYAVLDYREHHGRLPLGSPAGFLVGCLPWRPSCSSCRCCAGRAWCCWPPRFSGSTAR